MIASVENEKKNQKIARYSFSSTSCDIHHALAIKRLEYKHPSKTLLICVISRYYINCSGIASGSKSRKMVSHMCG